MLYALLVFLQVLGAVGMFALGGIEARTLGLRFDATTAEQLRGWMAPIGAISMVLAILTGIWLMLDRWGPAPWIPAAIAALVWIVGVGVAFERRTMPLLKYFAAGYEGGVLTSVRQMRPAFVTSHQLRVAAGVAILGLMTAKPGAIGSLVILTLMPVVGLVSARWFNRRAASEPATT